MVTKDNHVVIMAGGIGSRFWPMSTKERPKQFIDVMGCGRTLIQLTADRFEGICPPENMWVVTSEKYASLVHEQLPDIPEENILREPCRRNTAPCIAYVSWKIKARNPRANVVVSPSDHVVMNTREFQRVITSALQFTDGNDSILTLGMKPTRPETGYGYIQADLSTAAVANKEIFRVDSFKEKPDIETAEQYIRMKSYFWNAGIFVWNVKMVVNTIKRLVPDLAEIFDKIEPHFYKDDEQNIIDELFPTCPNISVDYAVMEKSKDVFVYPASFGWSDIGTWGSLYTHINPDENGNAVIGENIRTVDSMNCIIRSFGKKKVIVQGLDNYIVVDDNDCLLICKMQDEQLIKEWQK